MEKIKNKRFVFYGIVFLFLLALCFLFPYSHDDWAWGSREGIERLSNGFYNYNGRWVGNLLVMLLTRSYLLRNIFTAATLTLIAYLIDKFNLVKNKTIQLITIFLLIGISHLILRQAVVWTSGFTNYVFSSLLILIFCYLNKDIFSNSEEKKNTIFLSLFSLVLGFISALCVEHVTIYCVLLSIFVLVYRLIKYRKMSLHNLAYFIGTISGTILMFSNEAYHSIANNVDGYRTISPIVNAINNYFDVIYKELCFNNYLVNLLLSFSLIFLLFKSMSKNNKCKILKYLNIIILAGYPIYSLSSKLLGVSIFLNYTKYVNGVLTIVYLLSVFMSIIMSVKDKKDLFFILFNYFSIVLLTAPLLVVTPIGSRCFFPMYVFFIIIVCQLVSYIFVDIKNKDILKNINIVMRL